MASPCARGAKPRSSPPNTKAVAAARSALVRLASGTRCVAAIWATVIASLAAVAWTGAVPIVTSLSTVALYLAYVIPVALGLRSRLRGSDWPTLARWRLGRSGAAFNSIALVYTLFICFVLMMPPNELAAKTLAGVLAALTVTYIFEVRIKFVTPRWVSEEPSVSATIPDVLRSTRD